MEINLKSTKRYLKSSIKTTRDITVNFYRDNFDPLFEWRIGILNKDDILKEITNIEKGIGIQTNDEYSVNKISLLYGIYKENKEDGIDWKTIRNEFDEKLKNDWEKAYELIDLNPESSYNNDNRGNIIYFDSNDFENLNDEYELIRTEINDAVVELNLSGYSIIDIRENNSNDSNTTLTYINTSLNSVHLELLCNKINDILISLTENSVKTEINRIQDGAFIQASFIL